MLLLAFIENMQQLRTTGGWADHLVILTQSRSDYLHILQRCAVMPDAIIIRSSCKPHACHSRTA